MGREVRKLHKARGHTGDAIRCVSMYLLKRHPVRACSCSLFAAEIILPTSDVYLHDQSVRVWDQLARSDAERRRMAISKDTTVEQ